MRKLGWFLSLALLSGVAVCADETGDATNCGKRQSASRKSTKPSLRFLPSQTLILANGICNWPLPVGNSFGPIKRFSKAIAFSKTW